jgi:hypothetical protein
MRKARFLSVVCHLILVIFVVASDITSFTDTKCTRSWREIDTVNGYPDGLCKPLNVTQGQTFQIQELDRGCAGMFSMLPVRARLTCTVTLYGDNEGALMCSSTTKIVGHLATCYDSSWVYYSIDGCLTPASSSATLSTKPTATGPSATRTASTALEPRVHTGIIVGSTVAGVSCVILGLIGALLVLRRRRKAQSTDRKHELPEDQARVESDAAAEKKQAGELWADHAALEIGRNSRFEGMMREPRPVRGVNPLIQVRYVP